MSQIESLSQIEEKLNNLSLTAKNNIMNSSTNEELDQVYYPRVQIVLI